MSPVLENPGKSQQVEGDVRAQSEPPGFDRSTPRLLICKRRLVRHGSASKPAYCPTVIHSKARAELPASAGASHTHPRRDPS